MKNFILYFVAVTLFIISSSCENSLNPYGEFKEKYILNCIVRADTNYQVALLSKSYLAENFNPYSNTEDQSIKNALVRIWSGNDVVAILKDTVIERSSNDKYKSPYRIYYTDDFQPQPNFPIEIEAILPNGKKLRSSSRVPSDISFIEQSSDTIIPPKEKDYIRVTWSSDQENPVFIIRLGIYYFKYENGKKVRKILDVPMNYHKYNNEFIPNYPKPISDKAYSVDMNTINKAMELISKDDPKKENYEILSCILEVISLDENLSTYYNTTANANNAYSIKLDETDYSNISGGYGVFGVYNRNYYVLRFAHDYIRSFGYIPGLK